MATTLAARYPKSSGALLCNRCLPSVVSGSSDRDMMAMCSAAY